jgi:hypothetical protein
MRRQKFIRDDPNPNILMGNTNDKNFSEDTCSKTYGIPPPSTNTNICDKVTYLMIISSKKLQTYS